MAPVCPSVPDGSLRVSTTQVLIRDAERLIELAEGDEALERSPPLVGALAGPGWLSARVAFPGTRDLHVVYCWCMSRVRTNIEIEDTYVRAIMDRYGVRTKTEAVALALRHLAGQPMTRDEALAMRGAHAIEEIPADVALPPDA